MSIIPLAGFQTDRRLSRLFDERLPPEPTYPSIRPSEADFRLGGEEIVNGGSEKPLQYTACEEMKHAPPGSVSHIYIMSSMSLMR